MEGELGKSHPKSKGWHTFSEWHSVIVFDLSGKMTMFLSWDGFVGMGPKIPQSLWTSSPKDEKCMILSSQLDLCEHKDQDIKIQPCELMPPKQPKEASGRTKTPYFILQSSSQFSPCLPSQSHFPPPMDVTPSVESWPASLTPCSGCYLAKNTLLFPPCLSKLIYL